MAKRSRSQMENGRIQEQENLNQTANDTDVDNESEYEEEEVNGIENVMSSTQRMSGDQKVAVRNIIRMVMSRNLKGQLIRREHFTQAIGTNRVGFDSLVKIVNEELEQVYGLTLQLVSEINRISDKNQTKKAKQVYCVVNCLSAAAKQVLNEIWSEKIDKWPTTRKLHESQYFLFKHVNDEPMRNIELVKSGILLLVLSLLVISENHIVEVELIKTLKKYGISDNLNIRNSNLNLNLYDLLAEFRKKDYIEREVIKGSIESENITEYYLGKRALIEFPPESMFEYLKTLFIDSFDEQIAKKFIVTIERAYGVKLDIYDFYNQPQTNNNSNLGSNTESNSVSQINSAITTTEVSPQPEK